MIKPYPMHPYFSIQPSGGYFQFLLESGGQTLLVSRLYSCLPSCEKGIAGLVHQMANGYRPEPEQDRLGHFSFVIRHQQQMLIAHSPAFTSLEAREKALQHVCNTVAAADIRKPTASNSFSC